MPHIRAQSAEIRDGEQHPAHDKAEAGVHVPYEPGRLVQPLQQECLFQQQQYGVVYAPQDKIPAGPVPQAGQQPDDGDVQELPTLALAVAAQGM